MDLNRMFHIERLQRGGASEAEIVRAIEESEPAPSLDPIFTAVADVRVGAADVGEIDEPEGRRAA
jgi:hypothetical protein